MKCRILRLDLHKRPAEEKKIKTKKEGHTEAVLILPKYLNECTGGFYVRLLLVIALPLALTAWV